MTFSLGVVGAGQLAGQFATLFHHHPVINAVYATDLLPERAESLTVEVGLAGTFASFDDMIASPNIDSVAIFTKRWTHGPLVARALLAGKHVYSAVPMAISEQEIRVILDIVRETGLVYMMGETSFYNPATVYARQRVADGGFGRLFYAEGDYLHDMDLGFYEAYRYSGGEHRRATASYPPMLYSTHSIGGVLGAWDTHATAVSCVGVADERGDGVFDRDISQFRNNFSNASALFELAGGGSMRINEFRRVGYPSHLRESRFRFFGTEGSFEELATVAFWQTKEGVEDVSALLQSAASVPRDDSSLARVDPHLRDAFVSGYAPVHDPARIPPDVRSLPNGHEGSHHFLVDDFVTAVANRSVPPVNAWVAARFTLPGIVAHESALMGGARLVIPDLGEALAPSVVQYREIV